MRATKFVNEYPFNEMQSLAMGRKTILLISFIGLKFLLQYVLLSPEYELQRDEYLHLDLGQHLAWGYRSVPPFTAWVSVLIHALGNSMLWIKFFPSLFGALTLVVVWKAIEILGGNLYAMVLGATCVLLSALLRLNALFQPNSMDVLSWTALYLVVVLYVKTAHPKWLYTGAIVFALGFLNKYNIGFLVLGLLPALLLTEHRKLFARKEFYFAALLGLLLISPNLFWQYHYDFPVVQHLKELSSTQLVNVNRLDFLKTQLLFFTGALPVILAGIYALIFHQPFKKYRFFVLSLVFTLAVFLYFRAKDYYAIGIYPIYIAFGAVYVEEALKQGYARYLRLALPFFPVLFFIPMYQVLFPNRSPEFITLHSERYRRLGLLRWEDGKEHALPQDFADMLGWKELAHKVDSVYLSMPPGSNTLVLCDNYGQAGAINYYTRQNIKAVSFNGDYIDWFDLSKPYTNLIRIKEADEVGEEMKETAPFFEQSSMEGAITNQYSREYGTTIFSFIGAKIDIRQRIQEEINEKKDVQ